MLEIGVIFSDVTTPNRLTLVQGTTTPIYITINKLLSDGQSLSQVNLTGATVWFTLKRRLQDSDAAAIYQQVSTTNNIIIDPEMGLVKVVIPSATTAALPPWFADYYFEVQVKDASGQYLTGGTGSIGVYPSFTQSK